MKKINQVALFFIMAAVSAIFSDCNSNRHPGRIYMPDMTYSRAYETYDLHDSAKFTMDPAKKGGSRIYYDNKPIASTVKRGDLFPYTLPNDSIGYNMSASVKNPFDSLNMQQMAEAGRLYNINCAICHGDKGTANGPLATSGKIGGVANIASGEKANLSDGTMFHVMTYGKNMMGSYASQLDRQQRWMIAKYIRTLQQPAAKADSATVTSAKPDSAIIKKS